MRNREFTDLSTIFLKHTNKFPSKNDEKMRRDTNENYKILINTRHDVRTTLYGRCSENLKTTSYQRCSDVVCWPAGEELSFIIYLFYTVKRASNSLTSMPNDPSFFLSFFYFNQFFLLVSKHTSDASNNLNDMIERELIVG